MLEYFHTVGLDLEATQKAVAESRDARLQEVEADCLTDAERTEMEAVDGLNRVKA